MKKKAIQRKPSANQATCARYRHISRYNRNEQRSNICCWFSAMLRFVSSTKQRETDRSRCSHFWFCFPFIWDQNIWCVRVFPYLCTCRHHPPLQYLIKSCIFRNHLSLIWYLFLHLNRISYSFLPNRKKGTQRFPYNAYVYHNFNYFIMHSYMHHTIIGLKVLVDVASTSKEIRISGIFMGKIICHRTAKMHKITRNQHKKRKKRAHTVLSTFRE